MERKFSPLLSCIFLLLLLLNPFLLFSNANPPDHDKRRAKASAMDFMKPLSGARKGTTAKGLSQLKKYLSKLGYMSTTDTHVNDDHFDDNLELAIKKYQQFFNLAVTGMLDPSTTAKLQQPRCGVPDFPHTRSPNITGSKYTFFPGEPRWPPTKRTLTYSFPVGGRTDVNTSILIATGEWASVSPFKFRFIIDYDHADVKISFQYGDHGDGSPFDGTGGILAHAFAPTDGRLHFDEDERWVQGVEPGAFDLQTVGLHELGHILGLGHSTDGGSIMWPYIGSGLRKGLSRDDIDGIRALYPS